jgi:predicted permease
MLVASLYCEVVMRLDIRYALRQVARNKLFSLAVILLLAIGIGANTLIFSFVDVLLLRSLPVRAPGNLFLIGKLRPKRVRPDNEFFYSQFEDLSQRKDLFTGIVAEQSTDNSFLPFTEGGTTRLISTQIVSPNYFSELGIHAILGRVLTVADAAASSQVPVVLSYQFWQSQFSGRRTLLGKTIHIKEYPFVVVGILPREFHSLDIDRAPDVRFPLSAAVALSGRDVRDVRRNSYLGFQILARLAPGVKQATALAAISPGLRSSQEFLSREWISFAHPDGWSPEEAESYLKWVKDFWLQLQPVGHGLSELRTKFSTALTLLMCGVGLLFVIVCANIAGLLFAKSEERKREIAVRLSMGSGRSRLVRQFLTESLVLAIPGAFCGVALAYALCPVLAGMLPPTNGLPYYRLPRAITAEPDVRVMLFAVALSLLSAVIFGMAPAWRGTRLNLSEELKAGSRTFAGVQSGLIAIGVQVALAVVLISAAGLMLQTYWNLEHLNPGFDRAHVDEFLIDTRITGNSGTNATRFFSDLKEEVLKLPQIRSVAYASAELMQGIGIGTTVAPQGVVLPKKTFLNTSFNYVTPGYFETLGIPLLAGRTVDVRDLKAKPKSIVVNRAFADFFFPNQNPIGKAIVQGIDGTKPPTAIIVGVTGNAKYRTMRERDTPTFYQAANDKQKDVLYVRTYGDPVAVIGSVYKLIHKLDPHIVVLEANTLEQEVQRSLWQERLVTLLSGFFAVIALLLSGIGLYAALAYSVARRRWELGIRIAIGAQSVHVLATICTRAGVAVAIGLVVGLTASAALLGFTRSLLYGVNPVNLGTYVIAVCGVLICAALAVALPSWRAIRTDPAVALREE